MPVASREACFVLVSENRLHDGTRPRVACFTPARFTPPKRTQVVRANAYSRLRSVLANPDPKGGSLYSVRGQRDEAEAKQSHSRGRLCYTIVLWVSDRVLPADWLINPPWRILFHGLQSGPVRAWRGGRFRVREGAAGRARSQPAMSGERRRRCSWGRRIFA